MSTVRCESRLPIIVVWTLTLYTNKHCFDLRHENSHGMKKHVYIYLIDFYQLASCSRDKPKPEADLIAVFKRWMFKSVV